MQRMLIKRLILQAFDSDVAPDDAAHSAVYCDSETAVDTVQEAEA